MIFIPFSQPSGFCLFTVVASLVGPRQVLAFGHLQTNTVELDPIDSSSNQDGHSTSDADSSRPATDRPYFGDQISNQTVAVGRDAVFQCVVKNLNAHKVSFPMF